MFNGESKKRPTVSLRGKSKEEDRTEFIRRARAQREGRARERLHISSATTIQRVWRGRSCVGKWRELERKTWDRKMHDVGRVQSILASSGKVLQLPSPVLLTILSQLVNFHTFPRDAGRFRAALALVTAAPTAAPGGASGDPRGHGLFAPLEAPSSPSGDGSRGGGVGDSVGAAAATKAAAGALAAGDAWTVLVNRLGALCLQYIAQLAVAAAGAGVDAVGMDDGGGSRGGAGGGAGKGEKGDAMDLDEGTASASASSAGMEVLAAADSAVRVFALLSSPEGWCFRRALPETGGGKAERPSDHPCRRFLSSLALGRVLLRPGAEHSAGAGCYVDNDVGGAAATGDGDVMMRFLPSFRAVESMRAGASPQDACAEALCKISRFYPTFGGALVCVNKAGEHGAARHGLSFAYSYQGPRDQGSQTAHAVEVDENVCERLRVMAASSPRWSSAPW